MIEFCIFLFLPDKEIFTETEESSQCKKFYGYSAWYEKDNFGNINSCFDENKVDINLRYFLNKNLNKYLLNYPHNIPIDNYNYEIRDSLEIIGKAISPLSLSLRPILSW